MTSASGIVLFLPHIARSRSRSTFLFH